MQAPYSGPETTTSLNVLEELASSGLPQPVMLLGGWAVYFTVRDRWLTTFGEEYFGSRDIDLGLPPEADADALRSGNMPATLDVLVKKHQFTRQGMYQLVRFHDWETHEILDPEAVRTMDSIGTTASSRRKWLNSHALGGRTSRRSFRAWSSPSSPGTMTTWGAGGASTRAWWTGTSTTTGWPSGPGTNPPT